jgi:hypothetical protein
LSAPIGRLLADPDAIAIVDQHVPPLSAWLQENPLATGMSLREIAETQPDLVRSEVLTGLIDDLAELSGR